MGRFKKGQIVYKSCFYGGDPNKLLIRQYKYGYSKNCQYSNLDYHYDVNDKIIGSEKTIFDNIKDSLDYLEQEEMTSHEALNQSYFDDIKTYQNNIRHCKSNISSNTSCWNTKKSKLDSARKHLLEGADKEGE